MKGVETAQSRMLHGLSCGQPLRTGCVLHERIPESAPGSAGAQEPAQLGQHLAPTLETWGLRDGIPEQPLGTQVARQAANSSSVWSLSLEMINLVYAALVLSNSGAS